MAAGEGTPLLDTPDARAARLAANELVAARRAGDDAAAEERFRALRRHLDRHLARVRAEGRRRLS